MGVTCDEARTSISALLDGEASADAAARVAEHASACPGCAAFQERAQALHRRTRLAPAPPMSDLSGRVRAAVASESRTRRQRWWQWEATRGALAVVAFVQVGFAGPVLLLGHDGEAPLHVAHELGSFSVAIGVGLLLAAVRPRLAAGMLPIISVIAALLLTTAATDLALGHTELVDEAPHLLEVAGFLLLWRLAKVTGGSGGEPGLWASPPGVQTADNSSWADFARRDAGAGGSQPATGAWRRASGL